jgi:hypothetical protein
LAFREIRPQATQDISDLFEDAPPTPPSKKVEPVKLDSHFRLPGWDRSVPKVTKKRFSFPTIDTTNYKKFGIALLKVGIGCFLIWFGASSSGSAFGPASGKFGGQLAQVFYVYQVGMLLAMIGVIFIYDAINKFR